LLLDVVFFSNKNKRVHFAMASLYMVPPICPGQLPLMLQRDGRHEKVMCRKLDEGFKQQFNGYFSWDI
jgi:hypothetical protein